MKILPLSESSSFHSLPPEVGHGVNGGRTPTAGGRNAGARPAGGHSVLTGECSLREASCHPVAAGRIATAVAWSCSQVAHTALFKLPHYSGSLPLAARHSC